MGSRILLVEDNPPILEMMSYLLRAFGHSPNEACEGQQALELARREPPDLILCDIQLPGLDGYEVLRELKADPNLSGIPVVAVTALAMVGDKDRVLASGFDGYIAKPIDPQTFVGRVESYLLGSDPRTPRIRTIHKWDEPAGEKPVRGIKEGTNLRGRILVVDNTQVNLQFARSVLDQGGYQVFEASSADEALSIATKRTPSLVLCDLHMPEKDGVQLTWSFRQHPDLQKIPIVIISSSVFPEDDERAALELGASKFLRRPIEPERLLTEIEGLIGTRYDVNGSSHESISAL